METLVLTAADRCDRCSARAYVLVSVAVDLNIAQVVDVPNVGVTAILNRDVFKPQ